jgi:hypothetical protein
MRGMLASQGSMRKRNGWPVRGDLVAD